MAERPVEMYFKTHDPQYVAEDAVFIDMNSGDETRGREAISQMLNYIYHVAFDAHAEITHTILTKDSAVLEARFVGRHTGDFGGVPATGKEVNVPLCVVYDLENELIKTARIYMAVGAMMAQLNA